jgi:integrase
MRELVALEIPEGDIALQRDQAAAALLYLSGMRAGALVSLPIKAIDLGEREVRQWPSLGVRTKNDKAATTYLLDIPDLLAAVTSWDSFARARLPPTAMWYPPIISQWGEQTLSADPPGKHRNINLARRMRKLFQTAGLPYRSPHKFRHGHAVYALRNAETMADYKAVSMNLMHSDIRVTDSIYAPLASNEVKQRIDGLTDGGAEKGTAENSLARFVDSLSDAELSQTLIAVADRLSP